MSLLEYCSRTFCALDSIPNWIIIGNYLRQVFVTYFFFILRIIFVIVPYYYIKKLDMEDRIHRNTKPIYHIYLPNNGSILLIVMGCCCFFPLSLFVCYPLRMRVFVCRKMEQDEGGDVLCEDLTSCNPVTKRSLASQCRDLSTSRLWPFCVTRHNPRKKLSSLQHRETSRILNMCSGWNRQMYHLLVKILYLCCKSIKETPTIMYVHAKHSLLNYSYQLS